MTNKDKDQDWLDALAGKQQAQADSEEARQASALRKAIQQHETQFDTDEFDAEAGLQKLKFKLRREGLSGNSSRQFTNNRFVQFAMAASVVMVVGVMMHHYLPEDMPRNDAEIMRGTGLQQVVLAAEPEARLKQLTNELELLGIKYKVSRTDGKLILNIHDVDPAKEEVASFMERNHITPPVKSEVFLDIRPMAKP